MSTFGTASARLQRQPGEGVLLGVAAAIAAHIGIAARYVRLAFVGLAFAGGLGIALYGAYFIVLPTRLNPTRPRRAVVLEYVLAGMIALVCVGVAGSTLPRGGLIIPVALAGLGGALIWRQASHPERTRLRLLPRSSLAAGSDDVLGRIRIAGGAALVIVGAGLFLERTDVSALGDALLAALVTVVGIGLVTGPWWMRMASALSSEREERIRSQERADIAGRVHDSVLQTLALIQRNADSPREVTRLARGQERELRSLLYDSPAASGHFGDRIRAVAAEVEDGYAITIEVVLVGDTELDDRVAAAAAATREALVNAAKHSGCDTVSVYAEIDADEVCVYVKDRGVGFDLNAVGDDRQGVRRSITERMNRHGGRVEVRSEPGSGTEIAIQLPRRLKDEGI